MTATIHKLSAGSGFEYYMRQTAAHDISSLGQASLSAYYTEKGESPGRWLGTGLAAFDGIDPGDEVTEPQMRALYGLGLHPDAEQIEDRIFAEQLAAGKTPRQARTLAEKTARLGNPYRIYTKESEFRRRCAEAFTAYNLDRGLAWNTAIPDEVRAEIRTRIATDMFTTEYERAPLNDRELSGWVARNSRNPTTAVAGFDITFSPVKSVSALWAVAPVEIATLIEQAHHAAIADAVAYLEQHGTYTRLGANGVAQVDVQGLIVTLFDHRDSRAGDPDLHAHAVISGKVRTLDGLWRALDARMVYRLMVTISEVYNTRLEHYLHELVGLEFADRTDTAPDRPPIREVVGVDPGLCGLWSRRDADITARLGELTRRFQAEWGREPNPKEMLELSDRATLDTRPAKHDPRSLAQQRAGWWDEAVAQLGDEAAVAAMIWDALHPRPVARVAVTDAWIAETADRVLATVSGKRATWQRHHITAEVQRRIRGRVAPADWQTATNRVVDAVLIPARSIARLVPDRFDEPAVLRRVDGSSVFSVADSLVYTSSAVLAAERRLVSAALRTGAAVLPDQAIDLALLEFTANNSGRELNAGQAAMVREFATSGQVFSVGIAPAGTGKTVAMQVLTRAWRSEGGTVLGLAPTAASAAVLGTEIGDDITVATIDKLTWILDNLTPETAAFIRVPQWVHAIGPSTLVIIDEVAKAATRNLDLAIDFLARRGACIRGIGDDRQLSAVTAGGVIRDIAETAGARTLTRVMRFRNPAEAAATLALRDGDTAALAFYTDHDRVHVGTLDRVVDTTYRRWAADHAAGRDAVMLAPTRDIVADLNTRARTDRLAATGSATGPQVALADGLHASIGDVICTRRNHSALRFGTDNVRNGYRFTVTTVHPDGSLTAAHIGSRRRIRLPASYVGDHVTLGWATTIDSAQGITAERCHGVLTGSETRAQLYVVATRGRDRNDLYVQTAPDLAHAIHSEQAHQPPTVLDILTAILAREDTGRSATTLRREALDPTLRLPGAADALTHAVTTAAIDMAGAEVMARIDAAAERLRPGLTDCHAWPVLRGHLAVIAITPNNYGGVRDPVAELAEAIDERDFAGVRDDAAVLDWRLDASGLHFCGPGPLPWIPGVPEPLQQHPTLGPYLTARADRVTELAAAVAAAAREWNSGTAPNWATSFARPGVVTDPSLLPDLAVWRAARRIDPGERRPTGPPLPDFGSARHHQDILNERVTQSCGDLDATSLRWRNAVDAVDPRVVTDPYFPVLADRLDHAHRAGINVENLLRAAGDARPLPDEQPAAALWWRLAADIDPAALDAADLYSDPLRPAWITDLEDLFGPQLAAIIAADRAWPALVTAVNSADPTRWTPAAILSTAHQMLTDAAADTATVRRPDDWAAALALRIGRIVRHHADDLHARGVPDTEPPTVEEEEAAARHPHPDNPYPEPTAADLVALAATEFAAPATVPVPVPGEDADYLDWLTTQEPPPEDPAHLGTTDVSEEDHDNEYDDDWVWTPPVDPATIPEHRDLPPARRRIVLQAELDEYTTVLAELSAAYDAGQGRHRLAADPMIMDLRRRADDQRLLLLVARDAHDDWITADRHAQNCHTRVAELARQVEQERLADIGHDPDLDDLKHLAAALTDADLRAEYQQRITDMRAMPRITETAMDLASARHAADAADETTRAAKATAAAARDALYAAAGEKGVVTEADVHLTRSVVDDLDLTELNQARFRRQWKSYQLDRVGGPITPTAGNHTTAPDEVADIGVATAPEHDEMRDALLDDPLKRLTAVELAARIATLRRDIKLADATNAVMFRWTPRNTDTLGGDLTRQRLAAEATRRHTKLADAEAEQARRETLSAEQQAVEDLIRNDREPTEPAPTPQAAPAPSTTYEHDLAPDTGPEL